MPENNKLIRAAAMRGYIGTYTLPKSGQVNFYGVNGY